MNRPPWLLHRGPLVSLATALVALGLLILAAAPAAAQEEQAPLDADSTLYTLDADLRDELGLFPEVSGFRRATLYRVSGDEYELVIEYRDGTRTLRERRSLSWGDVQDLRNRISSRLQSRGVRVGLDQRGRYEFLAATTVLGLAEGGLLVGAAGAGGAPLVFFSGAAGFFVPLLATQNAKVTEAAGTLTGYGGVQGYLHAAELSVIAGGFDDGRTVAGIAALLGAAESTAGYVIGNRSGWSAGTGEMVAYNGLFGNYVGLSAGFLLEGGDDTDLPPVGASMALLGSAGGAYAGHRLSRSGYTAGDARIYANAAVSGTQLAGAIVAASDGASVRAGSAILLSGFLAGSTAGHLFVRDRDFTSTEGNLTVLGSFAGSLLGLAVTAGGDSEDGTAPLVASSVGSVLGLGITASVFSNDARRRARRSETAFDVNLRLTPSVTAARPAPESRRSPSLAERAIPRLTLRASF